MASKRIARLNEQLKRELSELIRTQVRDPRVGVVTVTAVEMASDLGSARVFVRIIGDQSEFKETLAGLDAAAPFLRGVLGRLLHIRRIPELRFREDRSMEHARRIEEILLEIVVPEDETIEEADPEVLDEVDPAAVVETDLASSEDEDVESKPASSD